MVFPAHVSWTAAGSMPGGEIWSVTTRCSDPFNPTADFAGLDLAAGCDDAMAAWAAFWAAGVVLATGQTLSGITGRVYNPAGEVVEQANSSVAGLVGAGSQQMPNQIALVASLVTSDQRRRGKGRLYLPILCLDLAAGTPFLGPTDRANIATRVATLLESSITWGFDSSPPSYGPSVVSSTYGTSTLITSCRIGSVFDTQRRRRNALVEAYSSAPVDQGVVPNP